MATLKINLLDNKPFKTDQESVKYISVVEKQARWQKIPQIWVNPVYESVLVKSVIFFYFLWGGVRYKYKLKNLCWGNETQWKLSNSNNFQFDFSKPNLSSSHSSESSMAEKKYEKTQCLQSRPSKTLCVSIIFHGHMHYSKLLTTKEQRKQSGFSLQDLKPMCTQHDFFMLLNFSKQSYQDPQRLLPVPMSFPCLLPQIPTMPVTQWLIRLKSLLQRIHSQVEVSQTDPELWEESPVTSV